MDGSYSHDESHGDQQPTNRKAKLSDLNKGDLIELISHLEHEVHNRESIIGEMVNQHTKQALYQAKYGRFGAADPFTALHRDSDKVTDDHFDHNQVKSLFDNQLQQLENLIETQRRAQTTMRDQKLAADERYRKVCLELDEARKRHARDTAQGDDVTVALEKEREKLHQDLAYAKNQLKKSEKDLKRTKSQLTHQVQLATKHKQVALDLIKERRKMVAKVTESEKRNQAIAQLLQKEQEDSLKSENSKLLQLEARMEKQLMDFDIEREQYKARIRKEEGKVKDLLLQLTDIKETVLSLQQDSSFSHIGSGQYVGGRESTDSASVPKGDNITPISLIKSVSERVTGSHESRTRELEPLTFTSTDHSVGEVIQRTVRLNPGPSMSPPPKQSSAITRTTTIDQPKLIHSPEISNKPRQSVIIPGTNQKPGAHILQRPSDYRATAGGRPFYYKPSAAAQQGETDKPPATPSSSPISIAAKPQQNISSRQSLSMKPTNQELSNTSIPIRVAMRNPVTTGNTAPQVSPKPVNMNAIKQSNYIISANNTANQPITTANTANRPMATANTTNRPVGMAPRSPTVPPHLAAVPPSTIDSKLVNVASWRNSAPGASVPGLDIPSARAIRPLSASSLSPNDEHTTAGPKAKPPPPVRNVSLPPTKKYQPIENTSS